MCLLVKSTTGGSACHQDMPQFKYHLRVHKPHHHSFHPSVDAAQASPPVGGTLQMISPVCVQWRDADGNTSKPLRFHTISTLAGVRHVGCPDDLATTSKNDTDDLLAVEDDRHFRHHHVRLLLGAFTTARLRATLPSLLRRHPDHTLEFYTLRGPTAIVDHLADLRALGLQSHVVAATTPSVSRLHLPPHGHGHDRLLLPFLQAVVDAADPEDHIVLRVLWPHGGSDTICAAATMLHPAGECFPWYAHLLDDGACAVTSHCHALVHRAATCHVDTAIDLSQPGDTTVNALLATFRFKRWLLGATTTDKVAANVTKCANLSAAQSLAKRRDLEAHVAALAHDKATLEAKVASLAHALAQAEAKCEHLTRTVDTLQRTTTVCHRVTTHENPHPLDIENQNGPPVHTGAPAASARGARSGAHCRSRVRALDARASTDWWQRRENEWLRQQWATEQARKAYVEGAYWSHASFKAKWLRAEATSRVLQRQLAVAKQINPR
ncbi:Aste57867_22833 [Aphanomyces stellatus]|uniref:Aste57867_22833 protein n=1 Tax=Aphanomyces stellatus TaxID=120398 RepID=A0A485LMP4_9STRA|nr:hypothetical protein As57867_022762 [Aphanomyces stellatus]VFT99484.1 Aste57867_22833 [Aphanomyces stellatus]